MALTEWVELLDIDPSQVANKLAAVATKFHSQGSVGNIAEVGNKDVSSLSDKVVIDLLLLLGEHVNHGEHYELVLL